MAGCRGLVGQDREHGLQFKATTMKTAPPTTAERIERYLGSGLVKEADSREEAGAGRPYWRWSTSSRTSFGTCISWAGVPARRGSKRIGPSLPLGSGRSAAALYVYTRPRLSQLPRLRFPHPRYRIILQEVKRKGSCWNVRSLPRLCNNLSTQSCR
jgi:hypothetical protein